MFRKLSVINIPLLIQIALFSIISSASLIAQDEDLLNTIFSDFEVGIKTKNVDQFFKHLDSEIYISLSNSVSGYFSANQSYHLLKKYIDDINPTTFKLTRQQSQSPYPYSTGSLYYNRSGLHGSYQVYMAVKKEERGWKITQITIN